MPRFLKVAEVPSDFHANVIKARLQSEGIFSIVKERFYGPYPLNSFAEVWVSQEEYYLAKEVLLGDAVDEVFENQKDSSLFTQRRNSHIRLLLPVALLLLCILVVLLI
jgi:hypothetical protein